MNDRLFTLGADGLHRGAYLQKCHTFCLHSDNLLFQLHLKGKSISNPKKEKEQLPPSNTFSPIPKV